MTLAFHCGQTLDNLLQLKRFAAVNQSCIKALIPQISNMKLSASIIALLVSSGIAAVVEPAPRDEGGMTAREVDGGNVFTDVEKRAGCSGNRLETDVCQGRRIAPFNSFNNW